VTARSATSSGRCTSRELACLRGRERGGDAAGDADSLACRPHRVRIQVTGSVGQVRPAGVVDDAADHGDAQRAPELAADVVQRRPDAGVAFGHCGHHGVAHRRHAEAGAEAEEAEDQEDHAGVRPGLEDPGEHDERCHDDEHHATLSARGATTVIGFPPAPEPSIMPIAGAIAVHADVPPGNVYYDFTSFTELVDAAIERHWEDVRRRTTPR
jgi:hypothetical protein